MGLILENYELKTLKSSLSFMTKAYQDKVLIDRNDAGTELALNRVTKKLNKIENGKLDLIVEEIQFCLCMLQGYTSFIQDVPEKATALVLQKKFINYLKKHYYDKVEITSEIELSNTQVKIILSVMNIVIKSLKKDADIDYKETLFSIQDKAKQKESGIFNFNKKELSVIVSIIHFGLDIISKADQSMVVNNVFVKEKDKCEDLIEKANRCIKEINAIDIDYIMSLYKE